MHNVIADLAMTRLKSQLYINVEICKQAKNICLKKLNLKEYINTIIIGYLPALEFISADLSISFVAKKWPSNRMSR